MKNKKIKILLHIMVVAWVCVIFMLSLQEGDVSSNLSNNIVQDIIGEQDNINDVNSFSAIKTIVRKSAHVTEYAILAILLCFNITKTKYRYIFVLLTGICVASTDEFIQTFVEGRGGSVTDVFIDSIGLFLGIVIFVILSKLRKKKLDKHT